MPKQKELRTVGEVLQVIGEDRARKLARVKARTAPKTWVWRKKLPADSYLAFMAELERAGCTAPASLWGMHEARA